MSTADDITRYDQDMDGSMEPSGTGRWVRFEDHDAELAAYRAVIAAELRSAIPTSDGAVLAAMIEQGVTVLQSHIVYAMTKTS